MNRFVNLKILANPLNWLTMIVWITIIGILLAVSEKSGIIPASETK